MLIKKIVLVTGASRGLGKNMALRLADKGLDVIITYHSQKDEANKVVASLEQRGVKAAALQLDTNNIKSFDQFIQKLVAVLKSHFNTDKFDYIVNNAGIGIAAKIEDGTEEMFDNLLNIQFKGVYFLTQQALKIMNDKGGIINISSGLARYCNPGYAIYASMKGAIEVLTRYLAKELGPRGIRANIVAPGAIETDFDGGHVRDNEKLNKVISGNIALGRVGQPDDIGGVVAFLCSDDAKWINAQRIEVSGGQGI